MSVKLVKMCELGKIGWISCAGTSELTEQSKDMLNDLYLQLGGDLFFKSVNPMKARTFFVSHERKRPCFL